MACKQVRPRIIFHNEIPRNLLKHIYILALDYNNSRLSIVLLKRYSFLAVTQNFSITQYVYDGLIQYCTHKYVYMQLIIIRIDTE